MKRKALKSLSIVAMSFGLCAYMPDPVIINESDFESSHINTNTPFTPIAINDGDSFLYNTTINDRLIFELQATSDMPEVNNVSFTFDNFTLQTYPENDQAFEIRNLTDNTLNITFVINGQNFITCGNSALSPIYLTSEGGAINVFFTLPNCSCDQYAEITIGTAMVSSEDIFVIERNNCPGSNKLLNCRANPGDNDNFLNVKPNPTQYYMISGYIHDYTEANLVEEDCTEPTCTESGNNVYLCPRCSTYVNEEVEPLGHDYVLDNEDTIPATCAEGGVNWYKCSRCEDSYSEETAQLEHDWVLSSTITAATCGAPGRGIYTCSLCEDTKEDVISNEGIDHIWGDWETITEPNCGTETNGLKRRTCTVCGQHEDETIYFEHHYRETTIVEGTCLREGQFGFVCDECGYYDPLEVENTGYVSDNHEGTQVLVIDTEPTEESEGLAHYEWSCCHEIVLDEHENPITVTLCKTNEHAWLLTETIEEATCAKPGRGYYECSKCGLTKEDDIIVEHTWSDWTTVSEVNCSTQTNGVKTRTCTVCGETDTSETEYRHTWVERTLTEGTCVTEGSWAMVCAVCGYYDPNQVHYTGLVSDRHVGLEELVIDREPTATREGEGHYEFSCCHEVVLNEEGNPITVTLCKTNEHEWCVEDILEEGTCTQDGVALYRCGVCGMTKQDTITGHQINEETRFSDSTCINPGSWGSQCEVCGKIFEIHYDEDLDPENHEGVKKLVVDVAATTEREGKGHYEWTCCGAIELNEREEPVEVTIPKLTVETSKDVLSDIIVGVDNQQGEEPGEKTAVAIALDEAKQETLLDVAQIANQAFEAVASVADEETRQQYVESIQAATESAVIAGSKLDNHVEEAANISIKLPEKSIPKLEEILKLFYSIQYNTILGKEINSLVLRAPNNINTDAGVTTGIDYTEDAAVYKKAVECIDNTVAHMAGAAGMIRVCSNEKVTTMVNTYIEQIGVRSFKDFDKQAADLEFAQKAYEAILANMQSQTISNLTESYEQLAKKAEGTELTALKETYNSQLEACNDINQFEWLVIEIMRQKYNSILSDKLDNKVISYDEYLAKFIPEGEDNLVAFKTIYTNIFYKWALGEDAITYGYTEDYGITLQELTDATISSVVLRDKPKEITGPTSTEIIVAIVFGVASLLTAGALISFEVVKKKKGVVVAYE